MNTSGSSKRMRIDVTALKPVTIVMMSLSFLMYLSALRIVSISGRGVTSSGSTFGEVKFDSDF